MSKPHDTVNYNILGTVNLLELCKKYKVKRFVFASSIYVNSKQGGFYRSSKRAAEDYVEEYNQRYNLNFTILRFDHFMVRDLIKIMVLEKSLNLEWFKFY